MKNFFPIVFATMLLPLAGCQKEAGTVDVNPSFDPSTNTVKTEFVLNVSTNTGKDTKTTAEMAQVGSNAKFLGMEQVHLMAYKLDDGNKNATHGNFFFNPVVNNQTVKAVRDYDLGMLFGEGAVSSSQSSRSVELSLPLGTNAVAFYGKARKTYDSDLQGSTVAQTTDALDLTKVAFSLESRLVSMNKFDVGAFLFSRMFTYFTASALVNENTFWSQPTGIEDKSYGFWWPIPSAADAAALAAAKPNPVDQDTQTVGTTDYTYYHGELSWKQLGKMYYYFADGINDTKENEVVKTSDATKGKYMKLSPLGEVLGEAYYVLTTIKKAGTYEELRAGSASSVLRTVQDLYSVIERGMDAEPTSWEENCAKLLCAQIQERILKFFTMNNGVLNYIKDSDGNYDVGTIKETIEKSTSPNDWSTVKDKVAACSTAELISYLPDTPHDQYGFPQNVGLPYGAAIITCDADINSQDHIDRFDYMKNIPAYGFGTSSTFPIANYRFPPELMYYGNSAIRTTAQTKKKDDYPASVSAWSEENQWSGWNSKAAVSSSTRSVAMLNTINYGTALLKSTVKYKTNVTTLKDNNAALHPGEADKDVAITAEGGFLVTGVIVGGQADVMGWDYTRRPNNGAYAGMTYDAQEKKFTGVAFDENKFDKMIYDRVVGGYQVGVSTTPIYTMVWDNYDATLPADAQSDVYVGIELLNNTGQDFWGEMNLVRDRGVFYLLGKLDLSTAVDTARENNSAAFADLSRKYYCYPPYDPATGETINAPRVFMQDYMTTANLVLGEDCLKHAYVTLPDLRSSQVSLGLSIDMSWSEGLAFEVEMGHLD